MGISLSPATLLNGQGINVSALVQQVLSESSGQLNVWDNQLVTLQSQAGALNGINNDLANLATAVQALSDPLGALTGQAATSSNNSILSATANSSSIAGTHQIVVNSLATAGAVYTNPLTDGNTSFLPNGATTGDIQLQVGGANGTTHDIAITQGSNDTLNTLANYINTQGWGVSASVVTDANGSRLALLSQATGTPGALAIVSNNTNLNFNTPLGGTNASLSIDGIPFSSTTNTVTGAIAGVTLNLASAAPGVSVQLNVGPNVAGETAAINNFVAAYNQVIGDINQQYTVNAATNSEGPLGSDGALRQVQSSLLSDAAYSVSGNGGFVNLASLGINTNNDGTLTVDSTQLNSVLTSNQSAFVNFFQNSSNTGFADNFNTDLVSLNDPSVGALSVDLTQNSAQQKDLNTSISNFETQLEAQQTQLTNRFDQVNASLQAYPLLLQQITETLGTLGSSGSSGSSASPTLTSGL